MNPKPDLVSVQNNATLPDQVVKLVATNARSCVSLAICFCLHSGPQQSSLGGCRKNILVCCWLHEALPGLHRKRAHFNIAICAERQAKEANKCSLCNSMQHPVLSLARLHVASNAQLCVSLATCFRLHSGPQQKRSLF